MEKIKINIPGEKIAAFCRRNHILKLALFGSVLRDDSRPDSDVDVLVEFDPLAKIGFMALGRMRRELSNILEREVDLVLQDGLKPRLRHSVISNSKTLYAA
jgi:predicted nucleotidyltransferase